MGWRRVQRPVGGPALASGVAWAIRPFGSGDNWSAGCNQHNARGDPRMGDAGRVVKRPPDQRRRKIYQSQPLLWRTVRPPCGRGKAAVDSLGGVLSVVGAG